MTWPCHSCQGRLCSPTPDPKVTHDPESPWFLVHLFWTNINQTKKNHDVGPQPNQPINRTPVSLKPGPSTSPKPDQSKENSMKKGKEKRRKQKEEEKNKTTTKKRRGKQRKRRKKEEEEEKHGCRPMGHPQSAAKERGRGRVAAPGPPRAPHRGKIRGAGAKTEKRATGVCTQRLFL